MNAAFFTLYADLAREGPGEPADVAWAARVAGIAPDARICDAGSGSGGDVPALLEAAPLGHVTAVDKHGPFIDRLLARHGADARVTAYRGDMARLKGPFDFIWCAGASYFLGLRKALGLWRPALAPGGAVAFSAPCWFTDAPSDAARAFWGDFEDTMSAADIAAEARAAGYEVLDTRPLADTAWQAFYGPLSARIDALRGGATPDLRAVLDMEAAQIAAWRAVRRETGYLLCVVRPA